MQRSTRQAILRAGCFFFSAAVLCMIAVPAIADDPFAPPPSDADVDDPAGGSRGGCACTDARDSAALLALSPRDSRLARTQQANPTFRAIVAPTTAAKAVFTLQTADGRTFYRDADVALPEAGGDVVVELPAEYALEPSEHYRWFLEVLCENDLDPDNPIAIGRVERVVSGVVPMATHGAAALLNVTDAAADLAESSGAASGDDEATIEAAIARAERYQRENLWYEAIDTLATARHRYPDASRLDRSWNSLLATAGLVPDAAEERND